MPLLGLLGFILILVAIYLAAIAGASLVVWLVVLFVGVLLLAAGRAGDPFA